MSFGNTVRYCALSFSGEGYLCSFLVENVIETNATLSSVEVSIITMQSENESFEIESLKFYLVILPKRWNSLLSYIAVE